jgi:hypothetical protein
MISKNNLFATATYPNWFWEVITRCVQNTDEISLLKFIVESDHSSKANMPDEPEFEKLFAELKKNFGEQ